MTEKYTEMRDETYTTIVDDSGEKKRTFWGAVTGAVGAVVGMFGSGAYITSKLIPFDTEVAARTRKDIVNRGGLGAGISETGGFAAGMGNHIIEEAHALDLIKQPEYSFAKRIRQIGGRGTAELIAAGVTALLAAGAYFLIVPRKEPKVTQVRVSDLYPVTHRPMSERGEICSKPTVSYADKIAAEKAAAAETSPSVS